MTIFRIRVNRINTDLTESQVLVFRVAESSQDNAEALGHLLATRWMKEYPGIPTRMVLDWPTPKELGLTHSMPMGTNI